MAYEDGGFGSYAENVAPEGNAAGGLSMGAQGLGLSAPTLAGMGLSLDTISQLGLSGRDLAPNIGAAAFGTYGQDPSMSSDYGFSGTARSGMANLGGNSYGLQATGYEGLQANANTRGYDMSPATQSVGLTGTPPTPDFFDTGAGRALQTFAGFVPVLGNLFNIGVNFARNQDPVQALLGMIPGMPGFAASTAYGAMQSRDPMNFLGDRALGLGASMLGEAAGGPLGARGASMLAGGVMSNAAAERAAYGAFGRGSPLDAGSSQQVAGQQSLTGEGSNPYLTMPSQLG